MQWILVLIATMALLACNKENAGNGSMLSSDGHSVRKVSDPAMAPVEAVQQVIATQEIIAAEPEDFTVDVQGRRVFLPDKGWLSAEQFWEIYYEHPQQLPVTLDHELLQKLQ